MKNLVLVLTFVLLGLQSFATDLFVIAGGPGNAYPTISAAIAAATDGDRIIIKPNAGGVPFLENLVIDKSLTFVSEDVNLRYVIQGSIEIVPAANRTISIHNLSSIENSASGISAGLVGPVGGRCTINIVNSSIVGDIFTNLANVSTRIIGSSDIENVRISHGKVIGSGIGSLTISDAAETSLATENIYIIGNTIGVNPGTTSASDSIDTQTTQYTFNFYNNRISASRGEYCLIVRNVKINSINNIFNNNFIGQADGVFIASNVVTTATVDIRNSSFEMDVTSDKAIRDFPSNGVTSKAFFNIYSATLTDGVIADEEASNTAVTDFSTARIDAGHPDIIYNDIDLTRNDIGVNGGSYAWDNFYPANADGKPQVYFLSIPGRVTTGTTIDVKAEAYSK